MPSAPAPQPPHEPDEAFSALSAIQKEGLNSVLLGLSFAALDANGQRILAAAAAAEGEEEEEEEEGRPAKKLKTSIYDPEKDLWTIIVDSGHFYPIGIHPFSKFDKAAERGALERWGATARFKHNVRDKATHEIHVGNFNTWVNYVVEFNPDYDAEAVLRYIYSSRPKVWTALLRVVKAAAKGELHQATLKAKHQISFLVPDPHVQRIYPAPKETKSKSDRGITHRALVHFLLSCTDRQKLPALTFTPADTMTVPDEEGQKILDEITHNKKDFDNSFYPSCFFRDFTTVGPGRMSDGLFESIAIVRLGRLYWIGAGHAFLGLCGQPIPPVCPARRHGVYQFTGRMLGHVLCQLRTMLSTADWSKKDGLYDYEALFNKIVSIFESEDPAVKAWADKILAALTKAIFDDQEILNFDAAMHKYHDAGDDLLAEIMGDGTVVDN